MVLSLNLNFILCKWEFCLNVCLCTICVPGIHKDQKKVSDFPGTRVIVSWAVVVHGFNLSTGEAEAGGFLSSRPAWSTQ